MKEGGKKGCAYFSMILYEVLERAMDSRLTDNDELSVWQGVDHVMAAPILCFE